MVDQIDRVPGPVPLAILLEDDVVDGVSAVIDERSDRGPAAAIVGAEKGGGIGAAGRPHVHHAGCHGPHADRDQQTIDGPAEIIRQRIALLVHHSLATASPESVSPDRHSSVARCAPNPASWY